jgi:hypothetical protein
VPSEPLPLREVQRRFYQLVTAPEGVRAGLRQYGVDELDLEATIRSRGDLSAVERLDIYANMYFYRLLDVLRGDYPKVLAVVGDAEFHNLVTDYLLARPPTHPSIRNAGERLPQFVRGHRLSARWSWLGDLAELERRRIEVFDAADVELLTFDQLRALGPEQFSMLGLRLVPAHAFVDAAFSVDEAWQALDSGNAAPAMAPAPTRLIVWRGEDTIVYHRRVDRVEAGLMLLLVDGAPFGVLCERLTRGHTDDEATRLAFELLSRWVNDGLLADARLYSPVDR